MKDLNQKGIEMSFVILFNGHVACLKTTIARELARETHLPLIATHTFGEVIGKGKLSNINLRQKRYERLFGVTDALLLNGNSVILDGTFCRKKWRERLYALCTKRNVDGIVMIRCFSSDNRIIKERLLKRKASVGSPEHHCHKFEDYLHDLRLEQTPLVANEMSKLDIILFDSAKMKITKKMFFRNSSISVAVENSLKKVIERIVPDNKYLSCVIKKNGVV